MNLKEETTRMVENVHDLTCDGKYDVKVDLIPRKEGNTRSDVKVTSLRSTAHNTRWRSKN